MEKRGLILLAMLLFLSACDRCLIEKKDYSCIGFEINDITHEDNNTIINEIEYISDNLSIKGLLAQPKEEGIYPLIIFNHGGRNGIEEINWIIELTKNNYIVLASHYRGQAGSEGKMEIALGETTDVLNLLECGKLLTNVDINNIGIMGFSHGGGITVQAIELSLDFKAAVEFWGATDIKKRFTNIKSEDDPAMHWVKSVDKPKGKIALLNDLLKRSPIYCIDQVNTPLLIFHGKKDKLMPYEFATDLAQALDNAKKEYELVTFDNIAHAFEREDGSKDEQVEKEAMRITLEWFDKYLK